MRIISKFNDYYDNGMMFGHDNTNVFVRNTKPIDLQLINKNILSKFQKDLIKFEAFSQLEKRTYVFEAFKILFCGKTYNGYLINTNTYSYGNNESYIIYDKNLFNKFLDEKQITLSKHRFWNSGYNIKKDEILDNKFQNDLLDFSIEEKICICVLRHINTYKWNDYDLMHYQNKFKFIVNPKLKDFEFYRVFDSYQCFQELEMFIGGILPKNDNDMTNISDKDRIQQHGFDKWSFRRMPS